MGLGLALGLSAGGSFLGGLLDGDGGVGAANAANAILNQRINSLFKEMGQREALRFREANKLYRSRLDNVMGDLDRVDAQVGQGTRASIRNANDQSQQAQASIMQRMQSSGLNNSSLAANAQRGVASDLARNVGDIYAREGQTRMQLGNTRAGFRSSLEGDIANLPLLQNQTEYARLLANTQALENQAHKPSGKSGGFGSLLGGLGGALGVGLGGGGFFGGGGSELGAFSVLDGWT